MQGNEHTHKATHPTEKESCQWCGFDECDRCDDDWAKSIHPMQGRSVATLVILSALGLIVLPILVCAALK